MVLLFLLFLVCAGHPCVVKVVIDHPEDVKKEELTLKSINEEKRGIEELETNSGLRISGEIDEPYLEGTHNGSHYKQGNYQVNNGFHPKRNVKNNSFFIDLVRNGPKNVNHVVSEGVSSFNNYWRIVSHMYRTFVGHFQKRFKNENASLANDKNTDQPKKLERENETTDFGEAVEGFEQGKTAYGIGNHNATQDPDFMTSFNDTKYLNQSKSPKSAIVELSKNNVSELENTSGESNPQKISLTTEQLNIAEVAKNENENVKTALPDSTKITTVQTDTTGNTIRENEYVTTEVINNNKSSNSQKTGLTMENFKTTEAAKNEKETVTKLSNFNKSSNIHEIDITTEHLIITEGVQNEMEIIMTELSNPNNSSDETNVTTKNFSTTEDAKTEMKNFETELSNNNESSIIHEISVQITTEHLITTKVVENEMKVIATEISITNNSSIPQETDITTEKLNTTEETKSEIKKTELPYVTKGFERVNEKRYTTEFGDMKSKKELERSTEHSKRKRRNAQTDLCSVTIGGKCLGELISIEEVSKEPLKKTEDPATTGVTENIDHLNVTEKSTSKKISPDDSINFEEELLEIVKQIRKKNKALEDQDVLL